MAKFRIENVVASTSLGHELDLKAIALALGGSEYEPEQFPGLIYRIQEPKTAILLFRSGKVVCTGAKSLENVKTAIDLVSKQIQAAGIPIKKDPEIEVQNIVATSYLGAASRHSKFRQDNHQPHGALARRDQAAERLGARVVWARKDGLQILGRVVALHASNGALGVGWDRAFPPQALGTQVKIIP